MKVSAVLLLLVLFTAPSFADERWYQVELLIFTNNSAHGLISEHWRTAPPFEPQVRADVLSLEEMVADSAYPFEHIANEDKQLAGNIAKMNQHWQYRPLLYIGWRQKFTRDAEAIPVYLDNQVVIKEVDPFLVKANELSQRFGGTALSQASNVSNKPGQSELDTLSASDRDATLAALQPLYELSGTAAVTLRRYLHLELDLEYNRLATDKDADQVKALYESLESEYLSFEISETRRMRSKQAHYFDHPAFGVIALITPVEEKPTSTQLEIETLPVKDLSAAETQELEQ